MAESPQKPKATKASKKVEVKGKTAPKDPAEKVSAKDQKILQVVNPASGFILARLILPDERNKLGFSKDSKAYQSCAMLEVIKYNHADDYLAKECPIGNFFFASMEEVAPLLNTHLYLLPAVRVQGYFPIATAQKAKSVGFSV